MILSQLLASHTTLPTTDKLAFAVLKRLTAAEAMSGLNFVYSKRDAEPLDTSTLDILKAVDQLESLIQVAHQTSLDKLRYKSAIKKQANTSAHHLLGSFNHDGERTDKIKKHIDTYDEKIVEQLKTSQQDNPFQKVRELLLSAYPAIDHGQLNSIVDRMTQSIHNLREHKEETFVFVESLTTNGIFSKKPDEKQTVAQSTSCVIA